MSHFTPFIKNSINITSTINEAAKDRNIQKEKVDFDLLGVQTLIKSDKYTQWTFIEEPIEKIFDEETIQSHSLQIRQEYKIKIRPYQVNNIAENIHITSNKTKSKIVATFKKGTIFPCDKNLAKILKREINRKKLRLNILIGHFEKNLNSTLIKLAKTVKCQTPLHKDIKIIIAQSPGVILPINDAIIPHYKKIQEEKKSYIDGVDADELIFEYIKPKRGKNGRNTQGKYIVTPKPVIKYDNYQPDDKTIRVQEDSNSIKYYSKIDGYVKIASKVVSISNDVAIKSASFRDTGSIETGENKDINVTINTKNSSDDAVGSGVNIDVKNLNVKGTIGSSAIVKANELSVDEQTHRNSQLEAVENAKIHLHRGNLKAKTADINILENGTIEADDVHVKKMLGGEIIGHRVTVEELASNAVITASESITIGRISGEHNKLIINPNKIKTYHENIEKLKTKLRTKKNKLTKIKVQHTADLTQHKERAQRIKVFQKRIATAIKTKTAPNKADMLRIKQYQDKTIKLEKDIENINSIENRINDINNELEKLYEAELHAQIINKSKYNGQTQVTFVDIKTSQEYSMIPDGIYKKIFLEKDGDDKKISWQ